MGTTGYLEQAFVVLDFQWMTMLRADNVPVLRVDDVAPPSAPGVPYLSHMPVCAEGGTVTHTAELCRPNPR